MFLVRQAATAILATVLLASGVFVPATVAQPTADSVIDTEITQPISSNWATNGGNLTNERYSTLDQVATWNVANLRPAWMTHLGSGTGSKYSQETTPIEQNGVLYITSGNDDIFAYNAVTGARIWAHHSNLFQKITTICCGWDNRGVALGQGLVFSGQVDGSVVAVSQATGKLVWSNHLVNWQDGYGFTAAPVYYNGVIYIGTTGGEYGTRGRIYALDAATGKQSWLFYTIPGPHDIGGNTWPAKGDAYLHGGAPIWVNVAIDPQLGLLYFSTGNAGPDLHGSVRPGDNLFASSIVALHMNGKLAWYFQAVHHDIWDFDLPSPTVLFDVKLHGQMRKGIAEIGKTGWVYILDRTNGKPLIGIHEKAVPQYPPQRTAATQPYPVGDAVMPQCGEHVQGFLRSACIFDPITNLDTVFAPLFEGGVVQSPMAFSPQTHYFYIGASIWPFDGVNNSAKLLPFTKGKFYFGTSPLNTLLGAHRSGTFTAIDATTNKIAWQIKTKMPLGEGSGALTTAGGLVFNGQPDGWFKAYDARTGKVLWQWQTGYGADAPAMTYDVNGVQYVAIAAGGNSLIGSKIGDAVWVFSLRSPASGKAIPQPTAPEPPWTVVTIRGPIVHTNKVTMIDYGFVAKGLPNFKNEDNLTSNRISVPVGTTVTWVNTGALAHTSTSSTGHWDTGLVQPGGSASIVMKKVGTFTYSCTPHPWMIGQVIVTPK